MILDLLRATAPEGWGVRELTFAAETTVRVASIDWTLVRSVRTCDEDVLATVRVHMDRIEAIKEAIEGLTFLRTIETRLVRAGYGGHLSIDGFDRFSLSAYFYKSLPDVESVRREIGFLDRFDLRGPT